MNEQSHPDCENCAARRERQDRIDQQVQEADARRKAARDAAKKELLNYIGEAYELNEDQSYDIYWAWREYEENWG